MKEAKTFVKETATGHHTGFTIGNQTFYLQEQEAEEGMSSKEYAQWYQKQLDVALNKLISPLPLVEIGDNIKLYGKETTVEGFKVSYNDALTPPQYEIILRTTKRGDPFKRSLKNIEVLTKSPNQ